MVTLSFEMRTKMMPLGLEDLFSAAENGDLECLKYAHEKDVLGMKRLVVMLPGMVARGLKYAHEKGCPWDRLTCFGCRKYHLEAENRHEKCPWDRLTCSWAEGSPRVFEIRHENGVLG